MIRAFNDRELMSVDSLFEILYSNIPRREPWSNEIDAEWKWQDWCSLLQGHLSTPPMIPKLNFRSIPTSQQITTELVHTYLITSIGLFHRPLPTSQQHPPQEFPTFCSKTFLQRKPLFTNTAIAIYQVKPWIKTNNFLNPKSPNWIGRQTKSN